jgi:hypothetical protein
MDGPMMVLNFDPNSDPDIRGCFKDDTARTLYLLWRRGHIVGEDFAVDCLSVATRISQLSIVTVDSLISCFPRGPGLDWGMPADVRAFCERYLDFFAGGSKVTWTLAHSVI